MNFNLMPENEKPLDVLISGGGFASIFRNIVCIGDSLSSGEFQTKEGDVSHYYDMFDYSWGQFAARAAGITVKNYSKGGMTAEKYRSSFAEERGFWDESVIPEAYIVALGVNDSRCVSDGTTPLGSIDDIDFDNIENCKHSFVGNYAYIVLRYGKFNPDSFFFLVTMPEDGQNKLTEQGKKRMEVKQKENECIRKIAEVIPNAFVIDLEKYAPVYDSEFISNFYFNGHMNPMGYELTSRMIVSYIDYIVRHNMGVFKKVGFINPENKKFLI